MAPTDCDAEYQADQETCRTLNPDTNSEEYKECMKRARAKYDSCAGYLAPAGGGTVTVNVNINLSGGSGDH